MLIAVLPTQVSEYWPLIKGDIESSMPPIGDYGSYDTNSILFHLMVNRMRLWLYTDEKQNTKGFVVTTILSDVSGVKTLLLYNVVILDTNVVVDWKKEFETLKTYAKHIGCSKIGAFVINENILAVLKVANIDTRFVFAHLNL
jgi:hypothetical protein